MATIWASLNRPFFISQSSGSESYTFLYSLLALGLGKRTILLNKPETGVMIQVFEYSSIVTKTRDY
jgi:hypothetical protein